MDFLLTPETRQFRSRLRELLDSEVMHQALRDGALDHPDDVDPRPAYRLLGERGWLAPDWPVELGGAGLDAAAACIVTEELAAHGIPDTAYANSVRNAGRCLLQCADQELRDRLLPPMARGELLTAVLYSEPDHGSDLAGLTTTAEPLEGGGWELHGTKTHSVKARHSDLAIVATRTREHRHPLLGITLFVADLRAPGVTVEPLATINHEPLHRIVFDGLRVGPSDVLGRLDEGWLVISEGLAVERVGIDYSSRVRAHLGWLAGRLPQGRDGLTDRLRRLSTAVEAGRLLAWQMAERLEDGGLDPAEAAGSKWLNSELMRELWQLGQEWSSPYDFLGAADPGAPADPAALLLAREAPGLSLSAGTSEMMLQVISGSLGLEVDDGV